MNERTKVPFKPLFLALHFVDLMCLRGLRVQGGETLASGGDWLGDPSHPYWARNPPVPPLSPPQRPPPHAACRCGCSYLMQSGPMDCSGDACRLASALGGLLVMSQRQGRQ